MQFNINNNDLQQIESLLKNNTNIDKLYTKLYTLELEGKKNTEEYLKHIQYLSIFLECEEYVYKKANLSIKKALSWIYLLDQKTNNKIVARIIYNLFSFIASDYDKLTNLSYVELQHIAKLLSIKATNTDIKTLSKCIVLKDIIEKNLYFTFSNFLQSYIESNSNKELKENLLAGKYNTLFTNPKIEKILLLNNFDISSIPHVIEDVPEELLPINKDFYISVKDLISYTIANNEIHMLLELSDYDYMNTEKITLSIFRQSMLRSAFQIMSDEKISNLNFEFLKYTESDNYKEIHQNNSISYNLIIHSFNEVKKDKKKRKIL